MTKDIEESEEQKADMMKLIIEQNIQVRQMEAEMEKIIKEKEESQKMAIIPLDAIPISQLPAIGKTTAITSFTHTASAEQVTKRLENMSIQSKEIKTLHDQLKALEVQKAKAEASCVTKLQKSQRLLEKLQKVERDTSIGQTLAQAKETIWMNILDSMNEIWPSIQIIFEQKGLIEKDTKIIVQGRENIG